MRDLDWRVVPIEKWPGEQTQERQQHRFSTERTRTGTFGSYSHRAREVNWSGTMDLLARELGELGAHDILLQMAVEDKDIRQDGWIRANARPKHPGVILTFESKHGPLSYPCDNFTDWQANVRAIALALEALRKVDRYGVTRRGEQYSGWKKLPPPGGSTSTMTAEVAAQVIADAAGWNSAPPTMLTKADVFRVAYRDAAKRTHPDAGGSVRDFQILQEAKAVLTAHHGGRA